MEAHAPEVDTCGQPVPVVGDRSGPDGTAVTAGQEPLGVPVHADLLDVLCDVFGVGPEDLLTQDPPPRGTGPLKKAAPAARKRAKA